MFTSQQLNSFFITPGTVSIPLTILSRCVSASQGCLSGIYRADGETYNQAHICPSRHLYFPCESNLFITLTVGVEKSFLTPLISCKYSILWVSVHLPGVTCVGFVFPCPECQKVSRCPSSPVAGGGKEALSHWWALLQTGRAGDFCAPFLLDFSKCTSETFREIITCHLGWHFIYSFAPSLYLLASSFLPILCPIFLVILLLSCCPSVYLPDHLEEADLLLGTASKVLRFT